MTARITPISPALHRPEVTRLLEYINAERSKAELRGRDYRKLGLRNEKLRAYSYAAGLATAHELVTQMWQAAVIDTNAVNAERGAAVEDDGNE